MAGRVDARLKELGIVLPKPTPVQGSYVPWVKSATFLFVSGQITTGPNGLEYGGTLGQDLNVDFGRKAARLAAINVLAQAADALEGDLDRITRVIKVTGFVASTANFQQHPEVINGASELFVDVFGELGRHARAAIGCSSLPRGSSVEVEAIFAFG
jgi:enamine deaminase RidA (YjgF/YER057c/UK114 family)